MESHRNPARPSLMVVSVLLFLAPALLIGMAFGSSASAGLPNTHEGILIGDIVSQSSALTPTITIYFPFLMKNHPPFRVPNDTYYASHQWSLQKINAHRAWTITTGSDDITIAIVDTGVDLDHPDLQAKIVPGYDFVNHDNDPSDDHGHGSHVAGIAAAATDNGLGVAGISWGARIMPVKVLDSAGEGFTDDVAQGVIWATEHGARIINLSLGDEEPLPVLRDATAYAHERGALIVAAAGNCAAGGYNCSGINPIISPAAYPHIIAVAATTKSDGHASFSEYHPYVDVAAPGVGIYSTFWDDTYGHSQGTSSATPHVAGLAALIWSVKPGLSNEQVRDIIEATAIDLGTPGKDDFFGYGRIDAYAALLRACSASLAPAERPVEHTQIDARPNPSGEFDDESSRRVKGRTTCSHEWRDDLSEAGTVLVKLRTGITASAARSLLEGLSASISGQIPEIGVVRLSVPVGHELETIAELERNPLVEYAELNHIVHIVD